MELCDIYSQRIKLAYPDLKFAVLSEPSSPAWTNTVADYTPVFYDAVALHDYYNKNTCIAAGQPCPDGCPDEYTTDRACRFDCGKCALGDFTRHEIPSELVAALAPFSDDTKLWFTEWGIISPNEYIGNNLDYMNTFLYSCFVQEHLMQQLVFNANNTNSQVEYSTHHRIGYHNRWSVIQTRLGSETSTKQSNFYTYQFFIPLANAEKAYHYNGINIPELIDSNSVSANSFVIKKTDDTDPKLLIYYSNKTTSPLPLNVSGIEPILLEDEVYNIATEANTSYLKAADSTGLYSSFGGTKFNETWYDNTDYPSLLVEEDLRIDLFDYALPPLSSGVIQIELENYTGLYSNKDQSKLFIYPNPSNDFIVIGGAEEETIQQISLHSLDGKRLDSFSETEINTAKLNIRSLNTGIYLIKIKTGDQEEVLKFVKQ